MEQESTSNQNPIDNTNINNEISEQKIISVNKFILLSIFSFSLYQIWWIYKSWKFFQQKERLDIMPAVRAIFSILFLSSLFRRINEFALEKNYQRTFYPTLLFFGYVFCNILAYLPDPYWLVSIFLTVICLIPPFKALNFAKSNSSDIRVEEQLRFSGRQIAIFVIGSIFWMLVLLGLLYPFNRTDASDY